jgi:hypothetical protein
MSHATACHSLSFEEDLAGRPARCRLPRRPAVRFHSLSAWKRAHGIRTQHTASHDPSELPWRATSRDGQLAHGRSERHACTRLAHNLVLPYPE